MQDLRLLGLFLCTVCAIGWWLHGALQNELILENRSGHRIEAILVAVPGDEMTFDDLPDGEERHDAWTPERDGAFTVAGRFADGTEFEGAFGYVTHGMTSRRAKIVVKPGGRLRFEMP